MQGIDFIAIDFETATGKRASICEAGICVVKDSKVVETKSWLVRPEDNQYNFWNIQIYGIHPEDTEDTLMIVLYLLPTMPLSISVAFANPWNIMDWNILISHIIVHCVQLAISMISGAIN